MINKSNNNTNNIFNKNSNNNNTNNNIIKKGTNNDTEKAIITPSLQSMNATTRSRYL